VDISTGFQAVLDIQSRNISKKIIRAYLLVSRLGTIVMLTMNIEIIPETFIAPDKCSEFKDILQCIISNNSSNESKLILHHS
jgi:hypothetical protein